MSLMNKQKSVSGQAIIEICFMGMFWLSIIAAALNIFKLGSTIETDRIKGHYILFQDHRISSTEFNFNNRTVFETIGLNNADPLSQLKQSFVIDTTIAGNGIPTLGQALPSNVLGQNVKAHIFEDLKLLE